MRKSTVLDKFLDAAFLAGVVAYNVNHRALTMSLRCNLVKAQEIVQSMGYKYNSESYFRKEKEVVSVTEIAEGVLLQYNYS